ncbi:hypothetical protein TRVL_08970 [Trypanosoma vivax]|nr:hypothetical protein TRVL_08970 [Trypanosoma vivax]
MIPSYVAPRKIPHAQVLVLNENPHRPYHEAWPSTITTSADFRSQFRPSTRITDHIATLCDVVSCDLVRTISEKRREHVRRRARCASCETSVNAISDELEVPW